MWKWEQITMDVFMKLAQTPRRFDVVWVNIHSLTKSTHFRAIWESSSTKKLANIYVQEVVSCHSVLYLFS